MKQNIRNYHNSKCNIDMKHNIKHSYPIVVIKAIPIKRKRVYVCVPKSMRV